MTFLEAAKAVLTEAGEALTAGEITRRALQKGLLSTGGKTPSATMSAQLSTAVKRLGDKAGFIKAGRGLWALSGQAVHTPSASPLAVRGGSSTMPAHWLLVSNPGIYDLDELFRKGSESWGGDYIKSAVSRKRIFEMRVGDTAFIYRTKPNADIYCEVKVASSPRQVGSSWAVDVEPIRKLDPPIQLRSLRDSPQLGSLEFLHNSRVSVSHVSPQEYDTISGLIGQEQESPADFTHDLIHWQLIRLGKAFGCKVWVAPDSRGHQHEGEKFGDLCLERLPDLGFNQQTEGLISNIDCLWVRGNSIQAAFEIEHTTSIYSGLLRLSDLVALQPNISIDLYIVAPDSRRPQVRKQLNRPTFNKLPRPLNQMVKFIPYHGLADLRHKVDAVAGFVQERLIATIAEECF